MPLHLHIEQERTWSLVRKYVPLPLRTSLLMLCLSVAYLGVGMFLDPISSFNLIQIDA